jgi:predicted nucleic acid-binding protein
VNGTLILDSEGLSRIVHDDRWVLNQLEMAYAEDLRVVASAVTLVEARDPRTSQARFDWATSRVAVEPVTKELARAASQLLGKHGMHGHQHAIDAMVAATALAAPAPRIMLTSDPDDMARLCGASVRVVPCSR